MPAGTKGESHAVQRVSAGRVSAYLVCVTLLAACGRGTTAPQSAGASEAAHVVGGVQVLDVTADPSVRFLQTTLTAHPGKVRINLHVVGKVNHDLAFSDGPMGDTGLASDATVSTTLLFATPGVYHFLCTIHPQMQGTLTIR